MVGVDDVALVDMPHSGHDAEDYIEALETVRVTLSQVRKEAATVFFIGGDFNIEL